MNLTIYKMDERLENKTSEDIDGVSGKYISTEIVPALSRKPTFYEFGKKSSSLEYYWRPRFIGDPHGRLL